MSTPAAGEQDVPEPESVLDPDAESDEEQVPTGLGSGAGSGLGHSLTHEPEPLLGGEDEGR